MSSEAAFDGGPAGRAASRALAAAIIGVERLETSAAFYRDVVGLEPGPIVSLEGAAFEAHWRLPRGARARAQCFSQRDVAVGRVALIEFEAPARRRVRRDGEYTIRGLWNLNFYVDDIRATCRELAGRGYRLWSEPVGYEVSARSGAPVEALFDGPDGLAINLVELTGGPDTVIGRVRAAVDAVGHTRTGWTAVSTTSHSVADADAAARFYRDVAGLDVLMDDVLDKPETNHFLRRPADARTRAVFVAGPHPFGKVALSQALNYAVPDHVVDAVAPNVGYLAQSFVVADLGSALAAAAACGAPAFSEPVTCDPWGCGAPALAAIRRVPGSGALVQLVEAAR